MKTTIETPVMKGELSDKEVKHLEEKILSHFRNNPRFDRHDKMVYQTKSMTQLNDYLGLAYTSSSSWAGLWVCNEEVYLDDQKKYIYQGFGMNAGGFAIAFLQDVEENELYIFI